MLVFKECVTTPGWIFSVSLNILGALCVFLDLLGVSQGGDLPLCCSLSKEGFPTGAGTVPAHRSLGATSHTLTVTKLFWVPYMLLKTQPNSEAVLFCSVLQARATWVLEFQGVLWALTPL